MLFKSLDKKIFNKMNKCLISIEKNIFKILFFFFYQIYTSFICTSHIYFHSWYITSGRIDKAIEMLKKFAKVNGKEVKQEIFDEFEKSCRTSNEKDQSHNKYTVLHLFKLPRLGRITIMLIVYW